MTINFDKQITIIPVGDRWYKIPYEINIDVTDVYGRKRITISEGFHFDGRSGGNLVDFIAPNLGSQDELKAWFLHDCMAYDIGWTFKETNEILYNNLRKCGYGWFRAKMIYSAVSMSDSWFGQPEIGDREYINIDKIKVRHYDK